jgi:transcriptional regulator with XRE-family HTH domain
MTGRGARLRDAMAAQGFRKQHAFAVLLQVNESTVTRWLADGPMSLESAIQICRSLDLSLDWLVLGRGAMRAHPAGAGEFVENFESSTTARLYLRLKPASRKLLDEFLESINAA